MKIIIGSDRSGLDLKHFIINCLLIKNIVVEDINFLESDDYPDVAKRVCDLVLKDSNCKGILICGTGMGMCIAANKIKKIRATLCSNVYCAEKSRTSNNANILTLGALTIGKEVAKSIVEVWIKNYDVNPRSKIKLDKINELENL
ncbi:MAG: RpiB/LacA/LacB family sugar-phosphate isomerase [Candidatus ainarchaeum sp.]|nr:RpiB/LacA/LacB family sugar-phosphate isomerase [Candidatus ainarchaeum sp.]MDD3976425.1 RpiB/LacA/LacB family sugar-phosphate isomerase [Candidatus ainarchaeum sp.]